MTREEMREYVRNHPINWPPLSQAQRLRLAVLLRPDLPCPASEDRPDQALVPRQAG
jgi:hypothetical protein